MEDFRIVRLFWERKEQAISAAAEKYGRYCASIAGNILGNKEDAEECVNDAYLQAWNSIPPQRPEVLSAFLGKITRNLALNRYKHNTADKRGGGELPAVLEELSELVSGEEDTEQAVHRQQLSHTIDLFLDTLSPEQRDMFLRRYWYTDRVSEIAARYKKSEGSVSMILLRLRQKLYIFFLERGFSL